MKTRMMTLAAALAIVAACSLAAGCSTDPVQQLTTNEQFRGQVLDAIVKNRALATQLVDKIMAADSVRVPIVDHMLKNEEVAKQVLARIGTNPDALDIVLNVAAHDSLTRDHLLTLLKGMQMASPRK